MKINKNIVTVIITSIILISLGFLFLNFQKNLNNSLANVQKNSLQSSLLNQRLSQFEALLAANDSKIEAINLKYDQLSKINPKIEKETADASINQHLNSINNSLAQLEDKLGTAGIMAFTTNQSIDASVLNDLYTDQLNQKKQKEYAINMKKLVKTQRDEDISRYGQELEKDLQKAHIFWDGEKDKEKLQERQKAYEDFLNKYPDSYATAALVMQNEFKNFKNNDLESLENFYDKTKDYDKCQDTVLKSWNMKPVVFIQSQLAEKYIADERFNEAEEIIEAMEENKDDRLWGGPDGTRTVAEFTKSLREKLK